MEYAPQIKLNLAESNHVSDIYTFNNVREDGTVVPLGTHNLTFKRNATTVVNVNMDDSTEASGVGVEFLESGEMPDGDEVKIDGGEIVDTEVDTNK